MEELAGQKDGQCKLSVQVYQVVSCNRGGGSLLSDGQELRGFLTIDRETPDLVDQTLQTSVESGALS